MRTTKSLPKHEGLHFLARSLGVLAIITLALYLRAMFVGGFLQISAGGELNSTILFLLLLCGSVSLIVAWRWPRLGGLMAILLAIPVAWSVGIAMETGNLLAIFVYSSPLLVAGLLYLLDSGYRK